MTRYAIARGGTVLGKREEAALRVQLGEMTPNWSWTATPLIQLQPAPQSLYLFGFQASRRGGARGISAGFACLAEKTVNLAGSAVEIEPRIPVLGRLAGNRVDTGSEEFRREFSVTCRDAAVAHAAVNPEIQRILLDHAARPGRAVGVVIGGCGVLVRSSWARGEPEWDYLTGMAPRLRAALP